MNEILFILHTIIIALCALGALRFGKEALVGFMCLNSILSNLFITKQITLWECPVTGGEVFAVGAIFTFNLLQEFFGREEARKAITIHFFAILFYLVMSQLHLWYIPNQFDIMDIHFAPLLALMPRITIASVFVYLIVQWTDARIYHALKQAAQGRFIVARSFMSLIISQLIDTTLFTYLALYGVVASPLHIIAVSMVIQLCAIACTAPFIKLAKFITPTGNHHA